MKTSPTVVIVVIVVAGALGAGCSHSSAIPADGGGAGGGGGGGGGNAGGNAGAGGGAGAAGGSGAGGADASGDGSCGASVTSDPASGVIVTDHGAVQGAMDGGAWSWKGIPYAAPPVGPLRWKPPADAACWGGTRNATQWGTECAQLDASGNVVGDEDCLTLNVWAPPTPPAAPLPVLVFVHGGGNVQGASSAQAKTGDYIYEGSTIASHAAAIVVSVNYRLGALGFLAHPALTAENTPPSSGNYGVLDQMAALRWVQENIAAFGGDPTKVLLFGQSAGALDTCVLLASPLAAGLFSRALMESGGCVQPTLASVENSGGMWAATAGCAGAADVPACLRALPFDAVTKNIPGTASVIGDPTKYPYGANIDGWVLTGDVSSTLSSGKHNHVPFIVGANRDETGMETPAMVTETDYETMVHALLGPTLGDMALMHYPASDYASPRAAFVALSSDARFICTARRVARAAAAGQTEPVRRYFFTHALDGSPARLYGAYHGLELLFVFHELTIAGYTPSAGETALGDAMVGYWTRFADTGDPDGGGAVAWPLYDPTADSYLGLDDTIAAGNGVRTSQCDFWDTVATD